MLILNQSVGMWEYLMRIWNARGLRKKILFSVFAIVIFRLLAHISVPGANLVALKEVFSRNSALGFFSALMGGSMENFSIVLMGLSPYINASIIIQLLTVVIPRLEALSKEGARGYETINQYTRWLTLPLAFVQSYGMVLLLNRLGGGQVLVDVKNLGVMLPIMLSVTAGTVFLVWLGELMTEKGLGNGVSMLIFAGIVSSIPAVLGQTFSLALVESNKAVSFLILVGITLLLTAFIIWFTEGRRDIPITYARQARGNESAIPIRVNQAGMIPIIFAISLVTFPNLFAQLFQDARSPWLAQIAKFITSHFNPSSPGIIYVLIYFILVVAFSYFYVGVTFKTENIAENIQKRGGFIPGIRPGRQTAEFLARVSQNLNLWGGIFLAMVAIFPYLFSYLTSEVGTGAVPLLISGAGLIIVVGVILELVRQINTELVMYDYEKFY